MKKILAALALVLLGVPSHADIKKCVDEIFTFQPVSGDVKNAADSFGAYAAHEVGSCAVLNKLNLPADSGISFKGFQLSDDGTETVQFLVMNYKLNFTDKCQLTIKKVVTGNPNWDSTKTVVSDPLCEPGPLL